MLSCLAKFTKEEQIKIHDECIKLILNEGLDAIFDSYTKNKMNARTKKVNKNFEKGIILLDNIFVLVLLLVFVYYLMAVRCHRTTRRIFR